MAGRHPPESVDGMHRNHWTACSGIRTGGLCRGGALASVSRRARESVCPEQPRDCVPQDDVLAYMWYNLAATQGNEDGQDYKDEIEPLLTREQIAEAQRLSREWIAAHPPGGN